MTAISEEERKSKANEAARAYRKTEEYRTWYRNHYSQNKPKYAEKSKRWRIENKDRYNSLVRKSRNRSQESILKSRSQARQWQKNNPEKHKAYKRKSGKKHYSKNRLEILSRQQIRYKTDAAYRSRIASHAAVWHKKNPHKVYLSRRRWTANNRAKVRAYAFANDRKRKALIKDRTVDKSNIIRFVESIKRKSRTKCYYCQSSIRSSDVNIDHVIPLTKGGLHSTSNLAVSCKRCNNRKYNIRIKDLVLPGQQLLDL